jgi:hypothetical protein
MAFVSPLYGPGRLPSGPGVRITAAEIDITMLNDVPSAQFFAALQMSFLGPTGDIWGGNHIGLQWYSGQGNTLGKAVNFGGYVDPAGRTAGVPFEVVGPNYLDVGRLLTENGPFTRLGEDPDRTFGFNFTVGKPVRLRVELVGNGTWRSFVNGVPFRDSFFPGTERMEYLVFWTEAGDAGKEYLVRFSRFAVWTADGVKHPITESTISLPTAPSSHRRMFTDLTGVIMEVEDNSVAVLPHNSVVRYPYIEEPATETEAVHGASQRLVYGPTTAAQLIARVRERLDEPSPKFWLDTAMLGWINEGLRDAGRFTRHIRDKRTVSTISGVSEYALPDDIIEVENVYWLPGDGREIPLSEQSYDGMNNVWGHWQNQRVGEPMTFSLSGTPPTLRAKLYPTPDAAGTLSMLVVRMPAPCATTASTLDWPPAWEDVIEDWVEMCALRKARDPRWQEAFSMYREKRDNLNTNGAYGAEPQHFVFDPHAGILPRWLVGE